MSVPALTGVLGLSDVRERAGALLAPQTDDDYPVMDAPVDAIHPPAYIIEWNDPWLDFQTPCLWFANLAVICATGRLDPESGVATLEQMIANVVMKFRADARGGWQQSASYSPRLLEMNGVSLLAARVVFRVPVTLNGGT